MLNNKETEDIYSNRGGLILEKHSMFDAVTDGNILELFSFTATGSFHMLTLHILTLQIIYHATASLYFKNYRKMIRGTLGTTNRLIMIHPHGPYASLQALRHQNMIN